MKKTEKVEIVCPVCGSETMIRSSLLNTTFNPFYCLKCNSLYLVTVDEKTKQPISKKWEDVVKSDKSGMETVTIEKPKNEPKLRGLSGLRPDEVLSEIGMLNAEVTRLKTELKNFEYLERDKEILEGLLRMHLVRNDQEHKFIIELPNGRVIEIKDSELEESQ